jgi:RimJ/RimL family protein N-acetyltransferase
MEDLEIIAGSEETILYKLEDLSRLTDKALKKMKWPAGARSRMFILTGKTDEDEKVLGAITVKDSVWGLYSADKADLVVDESVPFLPSIRLRPLKALYDVRKAYLDTRADWYRARGAEMTPRQQAESKKFTENSLPESRYVCFEKGGKVAGLLLLNEYSDYLGKLTDLVTWVWEEPSLDSAERRVIHAAMAAWLGVNAEGRVQAYVAASNPGAIKLFKDLGFRLEAVRVVKEK